MLESLLSLVLVYQYYLIFGVALLASLGFPLPSTALLIFSGALYAEGYFTLWDISIAGLFGCLSGDLLGYALSYRYGKDIFGKIGLKKVISSKAFRSFEPIFLRSSMVSVFLSRFIFTAVGPVVNILAGLTKMRVARYITMDILGEMLYVAICIGVGYSFGSQWESILVIIESASTTLLSTVALVLFISIIWKRLKVRAL